MGCSNSKSLANDLAQTSTTQPCSSSSSSSDDDADDDAEYALDVDRVNVSGNTSNELVMIGKKRSILKNSNSQECLFSVAQSMNKDEQETMFVSLREDDLIAAHSATTKEKQQQRQREQMKGGELSPRLRKKISFADDVENAEMNTSKEERTIKKAAMTTTMNWTSMFNRSSSNNVALDVSAVVTEKSNTDDDGSFSSEDVGLTNEEEDEEEWWFHGISVSTQRARSEVLDARLEAADGETERLRAIANLSRKTLVELIISAGITKEELQPEIEDLRKEIKKGRRKSVESMEIDDNDAEPFLYDSERISNLLSKFLDKIDSYDSTIGQANNKPVALTILTLWARTGDVEAALSRAELEKSRLAHSSAKWTLQSAMQAVNDTMARETVVKEKLKRRRKILDTATKRKEIAHRELETAETRLELAQEIRTNMNVALAKAVGDFETSKAALVLWKKRRNGAMMTFKDAINELTDDTVREVTAKREEFITRASKASEALSLAYSALGNRLQRALDEGSRHRPEPRDEQNSRTLNNDARAAFVAHNRAEQAMNAPISLHFAKLNALESSTRHLLAECEEAVTKGISLFYEAFKVEREAREKSETANLDAKICETTLEVAQSYAQTADREYADALYFAQSTMEHEITEVKDAMIVTKRRLEEASEQERIVQAELSEAIEKWGKKKALMSKDNKNSPWNAVTRAVNDVHELSTVIRGREMIANPVDEKVSFPVHSLNNEDGSNITTDAVSSDDVHQLRHNATEVGSIASTNSDLESLMRTLSGGSFTAPEAVRRTPVLDKIHNAAERYENEADVVRATRMVELKARESVDDFVGQIHNAAKG